LDHVRGTLGELQQAFFNGPTGPNTKAQWTAPAEWAAGWRERSYAVPTGGILGTSATDFFCVAVAAGSEALVKLLRSPGLTLIVLAAVLGFLVLAATRTEWRPAAPVRVARRRAWGQVLSAAAQMYLHRPSLFLGIGALFIPLGLLISVLQAFALGGFGLLGVDATGESAGALVALVIGFGTTMALLGLALVQAATSYAVVEIDEGRVIGPVAAYRVALGKLPPLLGGLAIAVAVFVALEATAILTPLAVWLAVRWMLLAQAVVLEDCSALDGLRRSAALVRRRWFRVASLVGVGAVLTLATGPLLGALLIFATEAPLALLNVVAGVVYALAMPFVALTTTYVYVDARAREALEPERPSGPLPAEIELGVRSA
jgi:hypothetical protein